jgi:ribosomal protein S14
MADRQYSGVKDEPVSPANAAEVGREGERDERSSTAGGRGEYLGLCANCGLRETCDKPKLPGGIWSCNDYSEL